MKDCLVFIKTGSSHLLKKQNIPWACTVHKVQGLSLAEVVVSFEFESQKSFNQRQMYVASSRITSINELYLIGKYNKAALKVNVLAKKEYLRIKT